MAKEDLALLAAKLTQYTINLLNLIGKEVDEQIGLWNKPKIGFLDQYVTAHAHAVKSQADVLKNYEEEERRAVERALFVMELLTIPAISWFGAALEPKVGPKLFFEYKDGLKVPDKYIRKRVHDEFQSKILGDAG